MNPMWDAMKFDECEEGHGVPANVYACTECGSLFMECGCPLGEGGCQGHPDEEGGA